MTTIRDVAKLAGVSFKTVSRVLNNDPYVSTQTAEKVRRVIDELGYRPNITAKGLAAKRAFLIGLVIQEIASDAFAMMVHGVEETARSHDYGVLLGCTGPSRAREESLVESLATSRRVDGILLVSNRIDTSYYLRAARLGVPLVVIDREIEGDDVPQVYTRNREGIYRATAHLIEGGRRRVAYITPVIDTSTTLERLEGYERALREHGIVYDGRVVVDHTGQRCQGYMAMNRLLTRADAPDGVVGFNDLVAIGAMQAIKEHGLRVPDDIAVVGFDDIEAASLVEPALTTVRQPLYEMGQAACRLLLELVMGKKPDVTRVVFDTTLVVRKSCGTSGAQGAADAAGAVAAARATGSHIGR